MRVRRQLLVAALVVATAGCSDGRSEHTGDASTSAPAPTASVGASDDQTEIEMQSPGSTPGVTPFYEVGDVDTGLAPFVEQARTALAERLDVDAATIETRAAVLVLWPDGAIGCPEKGMQYTQAQQDGSVIELDHDGATYRFHTGGSREPFLCAQPVLTPPVRVDGGDA